MRFDLNGKALQRLFEIWNLTLPGEQLVLFALRGCRLVEKPDGWVASVKLKPAELDYEHLRCTIGIWNRGKNRIFAAPGSTVPHRDNVLKAAGRKGNMRGRGANQMEPGYYTDLQKGEHLQGKLTGHAALRQTGCRFYRRSRHAPPYTQRDQLYFGNPYDNLHCAWNPDGDKAGFRSSGCMVIEGLPHCPRLADSVVNQGSWKIFHDLIYASPQKNFPLLLLPTGEVLRAKNEKKPKPRRCYGSEGEAVKDLQRTLARKKLYAGPCDGKLGVATYRAWNKAGLAGYIAT
jgi:hypothetical protein